MSTSLGKDNMNNDKALTVVEQKDVLFYEDMITAVRASNGRVYVPIKPICDTLGIDWASQYQRINRDEVLIAEKLTIVVTTMDGRQRPAVCLPLDFVSGFLFTVSAQRVKPELKDRLVRYQRECYKVLSQAFAEGQLTASSSFDELLNIDSPAVQAY